MTRNDAGSLVCSSGVSRVKLIHSVGSKTYALTSFAVEGMSRDRTVSGVAA